MSSKRQRYYIQIDDLSLARGDEPELSFDAATVAGLATAVTEALRQGDLFESWRMRQEEPDDVDPQLGQIDAQAEVSAKMVRSRVDMSIITGLPHALIKHRLRLLIGEHWRLHDVKAV